MLDVHAPDHRIGHVSDFFMHLFTITVGLLIALGLENAAETIHHNHQRREAETNIREELQRNLDKLKEGAPVVEQARQNLLQAMHDVEAIQQGKKPDPTQLNLVYSDETLNDGAWRTANSTGVLSYMNYDEVERYSDAYKEQASLEEAEAKALEDYLELTPLFQSGKPPDADQAKLILAALRRALAHVSGVLDYGAGTKGAYDKALK